MCARVMLSCTFVLTVQWVVKITGWWIFNWGYFVTFLRFFHLLVFFLYISESFDTCQLSLYFLTNCYGFGFSIFFDNFSPTVASNSSNVVILSFFHYLTRLKSFKCIRIDMQEGENSPFCIVLNEIAKWSRSKKKILCVSTYEAIMFCVRFCFL
jgi:hypothetical protein